MKKQLIATYHPFGREPVLRRLKDGTLVCFALTGGETEPDDKNFVAICKSCDDGRTWTKPQVLFSHPKRGCWATEIFTEGEKDIAFVHTYKAESWYLELQTFCSEYDVKTKSWGQPKSINGAINGCCIRQGIVLSNGDFLFPLYWQTVSNGFSSIAEGDYNSSKFPFVCGVALSSDKGATYHRYGLISSPESTLWEPNAVEVEDGHVVMYCRSDKGVLFISESFDFGRTWTAGEYSNIPNPNTKTTVCKIGADIFLINNFNDAKNPDGWSNRTNLCIYKSQDGKNFKKVASVCGADEQAFYPHAYVDYNQKTMYVAYENAKEHFISEFSFEELGVSM